MVGLTIVYFVDNAFKISETLSNLVSRADVKKMFLYSGWEVLGSLLLTYAYAVAIQLIGSVDGERMIEDLVGLYITGKPWSNAKKFSSDIKRFLDAHEIDEVLGAKIGE